MSADHLISHCCFPFPGTEMSSTDVFQLVEAFREQYSVWSDNSRDSQDNTIQLFKPNGVLNGFKAQNLEFCWFSSSTNGGKTFRGVIHCLCRGDSVDCSHSLHRVFDNGYVKDLGKMRYDWFKKCVEKFPAEAAEAKWVFDIVKGDLSEEAIQVLCSMNRLPFSNQLLEYDSIGEPVASADTMEWEAAAASPEPAAAAPPEPAAVEGMAVDATHHTAEALEAEATMAVEAPSIPGELAAPPGYPPATYEQDTQSSLFSQLLQLSSQDHVCKALQSVWAQYGKKKHGSIKEIQVEADAVRREIDLKYDETPETVGGRGGGKKRNSPKKPPLSLEDATEVWRAFNLYIALFYRHELELEWVLGGADSDIPRVAVPYQLPWMAPSTCPSTQFYQDVGAGYCCWYTAALPSALALNCTVGDDGYPRVPVDYMPDDCFASVFSMHWAKAFKELLLAHADRHWDTHMELDGIPVKELFVEWGTEVSDKQKAKILDQFADQGMPMGENIWRLASDYVFKRSAADSVEFPYPLVLCFHSTTGVCHPNTRFYDCPRPCLIRDVSENWPLAYWTFLKSVNKCLLEESDVPVPDNAMLAFIPIVQYMCKGVGIHTFTKLGATLRESKKKGNVFHFSLLCRWSFGSFKQINERNNVENKDAEYKHVLGSKQIAEEEKASPSLKQIEEEKAKQGGAAPSGAHKGRKPPAKRDAAAPKAPRGKAKS